MGLTAFKSIPQDIIQWSRYLTSLIVKPDPNTVTNDSFASRSANSIIGRAGNTIGVPSDIIAAADGRVLIRRAGTLQFDGLQVADLPSSLATDAEVAAADAVVTSAFQAADVVVTAAAATALAAHVAAADPHPVYTTATELAAALTPYDTRTVADTRNVLASAVLSGTATYDPPSLADGVGVTTTITVTGAAVGDFVLVSFSLDLQGITLTGYVSVADTVSARLQNESGGTLDLASGTLKARVWK